MQLWARRRATDVPAGGHYPGDFRLLEKKKGRRGDEEEPVQAEGTSRKRRVDASAQQSYEHELRADGVGFAYGGVSPGTLHAHGQLVRTHTVYYSIGLAGKYKLHVGLRQQSAPLPGSPFDLLVAPGAAFAPSTELPRDVLPLRGVVGEAWRGMVMFVNDKIGNQCVRGGAQVKMAISDSEAVECVTSDNGDGSYSFKWRSQKSGSYEVAVTIDGVPVGGSPTSLTMLAANLDVSNCEPSGQGLEKAVAGRPAVLRIRCHDRFSNPATPSINLKFGLALTAMETDRHGKEKRGKGGDKGGDKKEEIDTDLPNAKAARARKEDKDDEKGERKKRTMAETLTPMDFDGFWVDGMYEIRYSASKAGDHQLHLWADPEGEGARELLPGSPFMIHVRENRPSPENSTIGSQMEVRPPSQMESCPLGAFDAPAHRGARPLKRTDLDPPALSPSQTPALSPSQTPAL